MRLQKFLAESGVASRRASEKLIAEGRVKVDGLVVKTQGRKIDPEKNKVQVDGRNIKLVCPRLTLRSINLEAFCQLCRTH